MILAEGESSRIYQSLVYDSQLAVEADAGAIIREHPSLFYALFIMNQGAALEDAEAALEGEFSRILEEPVSDEELRKAKNQIRSSYILGRQSVEDKAGALAHAAVIHQDASTADGELELFLAVTEDDITRVVREYLVPSNRTVLTVLGPGAGP